jgi:hypothetical protein
VTGIPKSEIGKTQGEEALKCAACEKQRGTELDETGRMLCKRCLRQRRNRKARMGRRLR